MIWNNDDSKEASKEEDVDVEEEAVIEEKWELPSTFNLFSSHEVRKAYYPTRSKNNNYSTNCNSNSISSNDNECEEERYFLIECVEPTSPLDILAKSSLSSKQYDATGHCVWTGAFLLIDCIDQVLDFVFSQYFCKDDDKDDYDNERSNIHTSMKGTCQKVALDDEKLHRHRQKHIIELGCGTGIGGLAFLLASSELGATKQQRQICPNSQRRSASFDDIDFTCCFTDTDPAVLEVCERNCRLNKLLNESYTIQELTWGEDIESDMIQNRNFDIVLATDVLYDIDLLHPLFTTASKLLLQHHNQKSNHQRGIFLLSHVPRACYNGNNPPEAIENLELYIINKAKEYGFHLELVIQHPSSTSANNDDKDQTTQQDEEAHPLPSSLWCPTTTSFEGSAILVFSY